MGYRIAADATLLVHLAFILFAVFGALLAIRWRWMTLIHFPAACWAAGVELAGLICPLTYLENHFRILAGKAAYSESFIEHHLLGIIYPDGLTREIQIALAVGVIAINAAIYGWILLTRKDRLSD